MTQRMLGDIWLVDFEFSRGPGERPGPVRLTVQEYRTGRRPVPVLMELLQPGRFNLTPEEKRKAIIQAYRKKA